MKLPQNERHELKEEFTKKNKAWLPYWMVSCACGLGFQVTAEEWF